MGYGVLHEEMRFQEGERGLPIKHPCMLVKVWGGATKIKQAWGKVRLEAQVRWVCVCGGGDGERAPSSPLKLEWSSSSMKVSVDLNFCTMSPIFILRGSKFGP